MEIGPALPPHLSKKLNQSKEEKNAKNEEKQNYGESTRNEDEGQSDSDEEAEVYGPALPPGFQKNTANASKARVIGPMRPQLPTEYPSTATPNGLYGIYTTYTQLNH